MARRQLRMKKRRFSSEQDQTGKQLVPAIQQKVDPANFQSAQAKPGLTKDSPLAQSGSILQRIWDRDNHSGRTGDTVPISQQELSIHETARGNQQGAIQQKPETQKSVQGSLGNGQRQSAGVQRKPQSTGIKGVIQCQKLKIPLAKQVNYINQLQAVGASNLDQWQKQDIFQTFGDLGIRINDMLKFEVLAHYSALEYADENASAILLLHHLDRGDPIQLMAAAEFLTQNAIADDRRYAHRLKHPPYITGKLPADPNISYQTAKSLLGARDKVEAAEQALTSSIPKVDPGTENPDLRSRSASEQNAEQEYFQAIAELIKYLNQASEEVSSLLGVNVLNRFKNESMKTIFTTTARVLQGIETSGSRGGFTKARVRSRLREGHQAAGHNLDTNRLRITKS